MLREVEETHKRKDDITKVLIIEDEDLMFESIIRNMRSRIPVDDCIDRAKNISELESIIEK